MSMAKLARLMPEHLPLLIEPEIFADSDRHLAGELAFSEMPELLAQVNDKDAIARFELEFSRNDRGVVVVSGWINADLMLVCQRCLSPLQHNLHGPVSIGIVHNEEETGLLPDDLEPFMAESGKVSVLKLLEEELILSLPLSPLHEPSVCPATEKVEAHKAERENPFAILKNFRNGKT